MLKKFYYDGLDTGKTIYVIILRTKDGAYLDSDFHFKETPASPYLAMTELTPAAVASKIYYLADSTTVWEDGTYQMFVYEQAGVSPATNTDDKLSSSTFYIKSDEILERNYFYSAI
jgi:hypothetical protein